MISVSYFAVTKKKLPLKRKYLSYHTQHSATISSGLFNREITNFVVDNKLQYHKTFFLTYYSILGFTISTDEKITTIKL